MARFLGIPFTVHPIKSDEAISILLIEKCIKLIKNDNPIHPFVKYTIHDSDSERDE